MFHSMFSHNKKKPFPVTREGQMERMAAAEMGVPPPGKVSHRFRSGKDDDLFFIISQK